MSLFTALRAHGASRFTPSRRRLRRAGQSAAQTVVALTAIAVSVVVGAQLFGGHVDSELSNTAVGMSDPTHLVNSINGRRADGRRGSSNSSSNSGSSGSQSNGGSGGGSGGGSSSGSSNNGSSSGSSGDSGSSGSGSSGSGSSGSGSSSGGSSDSGSSSGGGLCP